MADSFGPIKRPIVPTEITSEGTPPPELAKYVRHEMGPGNVEQSAAPRVEQAVPTPQVPQQNTAIPNINPQVAHNVDTSVNDKLQSMLAKTQAQTQIYHEIKLPSLGRFYNGANGPSNGILNLREMTGREEEILATPHLVRNGTAMSRIFDQCIKEDFKSEDFLVADRVYILIYLRAITYGRNYNAKVVDPNTNQEFDYEIDLNALSVDYCPDDFGPANLTDMLPKSGWTFTYRLPTGSDELAIHKRSEQRAKDRRNTDAPNASAAYKLALLIDDIDGLRDKMAIERLIRDMHGLDRSKLRSAIDDIPFGVDTNVNIFNPFTMNEFTVRLPMGASFFSPAFPNKQESTR